MENTFYYLDKFFAIFSSQTKVQSYDDFLLHFRLILKVHIKDEKNLQTIITKFLDIKLDNINIEARLPLTKLEKVED